MTKFNFFLAKYSFFHSFDSATQGGRWTQAPPHPKKHRSEQDTMFRRNIRVQGRLQVRLDEIIRGPKPQTSFGISRNMVNPHTLVLNKIRNKWILWGSACVFLFTLPFSLPFIFPVFDAYQSQLCFVSKFGLFLYMSGVETLNYSQVQILRTHS
jgi:hypothetical protein